MVTTSRAENQVIHFGHLMCSLYHFELKLLSTFCKRVCHNRINSMVAVISCQKQKIFFFSLLSYLILRLASFNFQFRGTSLPNHPLESQNIFNILLFIIIKRILISLTLNSTVAKLTIMPGYYSVCPRTSSYILQSPNHMTFHDTCM